MINLRFSSFEKQLLDQLCKTNKGILDDAIAARDGSGEATRVVCTQPRRIAAISVAQRVAEERGESVGESVGCVKQG